METKKKTQKTQGQHGFSIVFHILEAESCRFEPHGWHGNCVASTRWRTWRCTQLKSWVFDKHLVKKRWIGCEKTQIQGRIDTTRSTCSTTGYTATSVTQSVVVYRISQAILGSQIFQTSFWVTKWPLKFPSIVKVFSEALVDGVV